MTTIRLKRGSGKPDSLQYGEVAVDTGAQIMYAGAADGKVIELSGGDINWGQIVDLPDWIVEIDPNKPDSINLSELEKQVIANTGDIDALKSDVILIWDALQQISDVADEALANSQTNAGLISSNTAEINLLKDEIALIESGLTFGGTYVTSSNTITNVDAYAQDRGFSEGQSLPLNTTADQQGIYFIVTEAGTAVNSDPVKAGDWLIAHSNGWVVVPYGFETISIDQVGGLQDKLDALELADSALEARVSALETEIDGGSYTSTPPFFK